MKLRRQLIAVLLLGVVATQAQASEVIQASVASVSGRSVFLDKGSNAGIVSGLQVRFFPPGGFLIEGVVVDLATRSCRVELNQGTIPPPVGTTAQIEVPSIPRPATRPATTQPVQTPVVEHPPWTRLDGPRTADMPLLSPAFSVAPEQRPTTYHGRVFTDFGITYDKSEGADNKYILARGGTAFVITNPFGQGGTFQFQGEYDHRSTDVSGGVNDSNDNVIIDRCSYTLGDQMYSPARLEVGRFYSFYLPELGLIDGVESAVRFTNGLSIGGAAGAYPRPFPERSEGDDVGFHAFMDYNPPGLNQVSATVGYQKTWHKLAPDRDLLVGHGSVWITKELWLYGSARADIYGASDKLKGSGAQLTDAWAQARYTPDSTQGIAGSYSHYSWADIKQNEFGLLPADLIQHGKVDRIEVSAWHDIAKDLRPTGRVNYFSDYKGSGFGGELDLDWTNIRGMFDLHGDIFYNKGSFIDDMGVRTEARLHLETVTFSIGYDCYRYGALGTLQETQYLIRNTVRCGVNWRLNSWYYSISADHYFGDRDDAYSVRGYVEYRF